MEYIQLIQVADLTLNSKEEIAMAKVDKKMHEYRMSGARWMLDYIKEYGIEAAEKELKVRGAVFLPMELSKKQLDDMVERVKLNTLDTVLILSAATLRDGFDFGQKRVQRFVDKFNEKAECMMDDYCTWEDQIKMLEEEINIHLEIRNNE